MPIHGSFNAACEELDIKPATVPEAVKKSINANGRKRASTLPTGPSQTAKATPV
jgi:hypothetical protein